MQVRGFMSDSFGTREGSGINYNLHPMEIVFLDGLRKKLVMPRLNCARRCNYGTDSSPLVGY